MFSNLLTQDLGVCLKDVPESVDIPGVGAVCGNFIVEEGKRSVNSSCFVL